MRNLVKAIQTNRHKGLIVLFAICICLTFNLTAFAAGSGVIEITQRDTESQSPVEGIKLTLYKVAEPSSENGSGFAITDEFAELGIDPDGLGEPEAAKEAVSKLDDFVETKSLGGLSTKSTSASGVATFDGLEDGIYFVKQTNTAKDFDELGYEYETESYLISLPRTDESGNVTRTISCQPKGNLVTRDNTSLVVYKVWKDNNNKYGKRPSEISVGLYNEDKLIEEVTLSAVNNWRYEWSNLDSDGSWSVKEMEVPSGYVSSVTRDGSSVTITNTYTPPNKPPNTGDSTGIVKWLVICALALVTITLLIIRGRKNS